MKQSIHSSLLLTLLVAGCATVDPTLPESVVPPEPALPQFDPQSASSIRSSELLKAYPLNRYEEPGNPTLMHEAHALYRVEQTPQWNLQPVPAVTATNHSRVLEAELEQKIVEQNRLLQATYEQNERLSKEIELMRQESDKARAATVAQSELQSRMEAQQAELDKLRARQAELDKPLPVSKPAGWQEWIQQTINPSKKGTRP